MARVHPHRPGRDHDLAAADPRGRRPPGHSARRLAAHPSAAGHTRPRRHRIIIAVDGKTARGARRPDGSRVHLLSALDTSIGIVLAQVTVAAKSNEIPAFTPLLDAVEAVLGSLDGLVLQAFQAMIAPFGHQVREARRQTARSTGRRSPTSSGGSS
jgi:hypothetical protein